MANTPNLKLPLISPSQAQKHVTVNEALTRLDMATNATVERADLSSPPVTAVEGEAYIIAEGASLEWEGHAGELALHSNGGWLFAQPIIGWQVWNKAAGKQAMFDGTAWVTGGNAVSQGGAGTGLSVVETDHVVSAGATNLTAPLIPSHAVVLGVSARVIGSVSGGLISWKLGVAGADDRYGSGLGLSLNSYAKGLSGSPVTYWSDTELLLTAEGGNFNSGQIRLAVHCFEIIPPRMV